MSSSSQSSTLLATQISDIAPAAQAVARARRIAVLCGISCAAGVPDFRSSEGLFKTLKDRNPKAGLSSGKDLFDVSLFQNGTTTSLFYQMIAELKALADKAQPTAFHLLLKELDDLGKLFRVYTQNIDGLEAKAGLSFGLDAVGKPPSTNVGVKRKRTALSRSSSLSSLSPSESEDSGTPSSQENIQLPTPPASIASGGRRAPATSAACRVIPLHGSMATLSCPKRPHRIACESSHLDCLAAKQAIACPKCSEEDATRQATSSRLRGVGVMRSDVVLYGEEHFDALRIGEITQRDLMGPRPDLLLVVGTSLKVPGTKRLVRELSKVVQPAQPKEGEIRSVYVNLYEPPSDMKGVFDTWVQGDVQDATQVIAQTVRMRADEAARRKALTGNGTLGFPVVKRKRGGKKKAAAPRPKPRAPKPEAAPRVKPSFEKRFMEDVNVFREPIVPGLGLRHAKRYPAPVLPALPPTPPTETFPTWLAGAPVTVHAPLPIFPGLTSHFFPVKKPSSSSKL